MVFSQQDHIRSQDVASVIEELEKVKNHRSKRNLIRSLGRLKKPNQQVLSTLVAILRKDGNRRLRREAVDALANLGVKARSVRKELVLYLNDDSIKHHIAEALVQLQAYSSILEAAKSTNPKIREMAAWSFYSMEDKAHHFQTTIEELCHDEYSNVRNIARMAQNIIDVYRVWRRKNDATLKDLNSKDESKRIAAIKKLAHLGNEAVPVLLKVKNGLDEKIHKEIYKEVLASIKVHKTRISNTLVEYKEYLIAKYDFENQQKQAQQAKVEDAEYKEGFWYLDIQRATKAAKKYQKPLLVVFRCDP